MHNTGTDDLFLSGLACQSMIHFLSKYLILQRGEERWGVEKATGQLSHTASLNIVIRALEIRNHNAEQRLLMFKSSKRCSFQIRMKGEMNKETDRHTETQSQQ